MKRCLTCLFKGKEGFVGHMDCTPAGVLTCRCPGDNVAAMANILKAKGADVIHVCTCTFARKTARGWRAAEGGFCDHIEEIIDRIQTETGLPVVKGTAHLPVDYRLQTYWAVSSTSMR